MEPNGEKNDVANLVLTIPKYKTWISESAWKNWEDFLADISFYFKGTCQSQWILMDLIHISTQTVDTPREHDAEVAEEPEEHCSVCYLLCSTFTMHANFVSDYLHILN